MFKNKPEKASRCSVCIVVFLCASLQGLIHNTQHPEKKNKKQNSRPPGSALGSSRRTLHQDCSTANSPPNSPTTQAHSPASPSQPIALSPWMGHVPLRLCQSLPKPAEDQISQLHSELAGFLFPERPPHSSITVPPSAFGTKRQGQKDTRVTLIFKMQPDHLKGNLRSWACLKRKWNWLLVKAPLGLVASGPQNDNCQRAGLCTHSHTCTLPDTHTPEGPGFFAQGDACSL